MERCPLCHDELDDGAALHCGECGLSACFECLNGHNCAAFHISYDSGLDEDCD